MSNDQIRHIHMVSKESTQNRGQASKKRRPRIPSICVCVFFEGTFRGCVKGKPKGKNPLKVPGIAQETTNAHFSATVPWPGCHKNSNEQRTK